MSVLEAWKPTSVVSVQSPFVSSWSTDDFQEHESGWTVRDPWTGIFGAGADRDSAYEDFHRALVEHFDVLARQEALSPELAAQYTYLRRRLT